MLLHDVPVNIIIRWKNAAAVVVTVKILSLCGVNLNQIPLTTLFTEHVSGAVKSRNAPAVSYVLGVALLIMAVAFTHSSFGGRASS